MAHLQQDEDDPSFSYHDLRDEDGGSRDVRISVADAVAAEVSPEFPDASQQSTVSASTENWGGSDEDSVSILRRESARQLVSDGNAGDSGGGARIVRDSRIRQRMSIANDPPSFGGKVLRGRTLVGRYTARVGSQATCYARRLPGEGAAGGDAARRAEPAQGRVARIDRADGSALQFRRLVGRGGEREQY
jgi:hypothetical protein